MSWASRFDAAYNRLAEFENTEEAYSNLEKAGKKAPDLWNGPDGVMTKDAHRDLVEGHWGVYAEITYIRNLLQADGYLAPAQIQKRVNEIRRRQESLRMNEIREF